MQVLTQPPQLDPSKYGLKGETKTGWKLFEASELETNMPSRSVLAYITTDTVDEEGDVVVPQGIDFSRFKKSSTVFWNHEYDKPCATCDGFEHRGRGIVARTVFPTRPEGHAGQWLPDDAWALFASEPPVVKSFSIGFAYLEVRPPTEKDVKAYGDGVKQVVSKARLLEYSVAPLPMNEDALALAIQKGVMSPSAARRIYGEVPEPPPDPKRISIKSPRRVITIRREPRLVVRRGLGVLTREGMHDEYTYVRGRVYERSRRR